VKATTLKALANAGALADSFRVPNLHFRFYPGCGNPDGLELANAFGVTLLYSNALDVILLTWPPKLRN